MNYLSSLLSMRRITSNHIDSLLLRAEHNQQTFETHRRAPNPLRIHFKPRQGQARENPHHPRSHEYPRPQYP